jgi:hypothetical protein
MVYHNFITGHPSQILESLNRTIGQYKWRYSEVKVGITGRNPEERFREHLQTRSWSQMVVIYKTDSIAYANQVEAYLVQRHYIDLVNVRSGGGSQLTSFGPNYLYVLLE